MKARCGSFRNCFRPFVSVREQGYTPTTAHMNPYRRASNRCSSAFGLLESLDPHYKNSGNEERDRRLQVVKLLTALSYCVGDSSLFAVLLQLSLIVYRFEF